MTLSTFQALVHSLYSGDANTPDSTSGEWSVRLNYLKAAINAWDTSNGMFWNELYTLLSTAADGTKTVSASTLAYATPTDFRFLAGYVETYTVSNIRTKWKIIKPEEAALYTGEGVTTLEDGYVYVTGNKKAGFYINFSSQPTISDTIEYPYYKDAFEPSTSAHVIEMSDPYFAVYFALSKLHEQDGEGDRATYAMSQAESKLDAMKFLNAMKPNYQENSVQDSTVLRTGVGFGA
tara:strand:- start:5738 stop:6442 length:705 start_codon:yes stop_codon:yes gene_type:complete